LCKSTLQFEIWLTESYSWEELSAKEITSACQYVQQHLPSLNARFQALNLVAINTIVQGLHAHSWTYAELSKGGTRLMEVVGKHANLKELERGQIVLLSTPAPLNSASHLVMEGDMTDAGTSVSMEGTGECHRGIPRRALYARKRPKLLSGGGTSLTSQADSAPLPVPTVDSTRSNDTTRSNQLDRPRLPTPSDVLPSTFVMISEDGPTTEYYNRMFGNC
jgi:hypothetical protein